MPRVVNRIAAKIISTADYQYDAKANSSGNNELSFTNKKNFSACANGSVASKLLLARRAGNAPSCVILTSRAVSAMHCSALPRP